MAIDYESIGRRIKYYRQQKGLSQEELGDKINSTRGHIAKIEAGGELPALRCSFSLPTR